MPVTALGDGARVGIDIDADATVIHVLEIQYTGGSLLRRAYTDHEVADRHWEFATTRASVDWAKRYEVTVSTVWRKQEEWEKP